MLMVIGRSQVASLLDFRDCIEVMRGAMATLSAGHTRQILRQILPVSGREVLSVMAGVMPAEIGFGSKVISVFPQNSKAGRQSHQGVVILFEPTNGEPICVLHAGEITRVRTAAASAVATDLLANTEASRLAVLGYGEQGQAHVEAIANVRDLAHVTIWGRSREEAVRVARQLSETLGLSVSAADTVREAVRSADIICTTTSAVDPILRGDWIAPGTHINLVGSSEGSSAEVDGDVLRRARVFADHREGVLQQGGEYLRAHAAGLVAEQHIVGEIGDVLNGVLQGRTDIRQVTAYKSLGHVVQDIAAARYLYDVLRDAPDMPLVDF